MRCWPSRSGSAICWKVSAGFTQAGCKSGVAEQETPVPADTQASPRPLRVLLAEDNRINQQFAAALLGKAGHVVTFARNGHEAVDAVRNTVFDVVLMDVQMPGMDGLEATKHIRSLPAPACSVPIIALTAHAMQGAREEYIAAGMDDYVSKPIKPALLLRKMASIGRNPADDADRSPCSVPPVLESANQEPLLDSEVLDGLRDLFPPQQMHEYIGLFRASTAERLARMNAAAAAMNVAGLGAEAHAITGTAGTIGAMRLSAIARELETACKRGAEPALLASLAEALRQRAEETDRELANRFDVQMPAAA